MKEYFKTLSQYLRGKKALICSILLILIAQALVILCFQIAYKEIFDTISHNLPLATIFTWLGVILVASIIRILLLIGGDYLIAKITIYVFNQLRSKLYNHLQWLSVGFYQRTHMASSVSGYTYELQQSEIAMRQTLPILISNFLTFFFAFALLFYFDYRLATLSFILISGTVVASSFFLKPAREITRLNQITNTRLISLIDEVARQYLNIQAFNLQTSFYQKFKKFLENYSLNLIKGVLKNSLVGRITIFGFLLAEVIIFGTGAIMTHKGLMSTGTLFFFFTCVWNISAAFFSTSARFPDLISAGVGMSRLKELFQEETDFPVDDHKRKEPFPPLKEGIEMRKISFFHHQNPIVNEVSLRIPAGKTIALMGTTGSGKTSILNLLLGCYYPSKGDILFDGKELREIGQKSLREQIGVVFQHTPLFNISLKENIRVGKLEASDEEVIKAAKLAEIHDYIVSLPQGYNTLIKEFGSNLSGGQKQRIALARVLLRNPSILLLDEHTAALDPIVESQVNATIMKQTQGKTVIMATHRVGIAKQADMICMLEKGKIIELGTHQELFEQKGRYYEMWQRQRGSDVDKKETMSVRFLRDNFFKDCPEELLQEAAEQFILEWVDDGTVVFEKGSYGDKFYLIVRGQVEVRNPDNLPSNPVVGTLQEGDFFGEIALLKNIGRTHQIVTTAHCIFLTLHASQFQILVEKSPQLLKMFEEAFKHYR